MAKGSTGSNVGTGGMATKLAAAKIEQGGLSISESRFFGSARDFKRDILKQARSKLA